MCVCVLHMNRTQLGSTNCGVQVCRTKYTIKSYIKSGSIYGLHT